MAARRFEERVALITGGGSGIGRATAIRLAAEGATVVCADVNEAGAAETAGLVREAGGQASQVACDVSDKASATAAVATTIERHGRLHVLANVAGIGGFRHSIDETLELWNKTIAVNLTGTFLMCQAALPHVISTKGAIVNVASVAGLKSHPYAAAYCASKGGIVAMTQALAVEFARKGVRINCLCPGGVETPLLSKFALPEGGNPRQLMRIAPILDRMAKPSEIAAAIAFLASDDASYVMGSTLVVDGAMIA